MNIIIMIILTSYLTNHISSLHDRLHSISERENAKPELAQRKFERNSMKLGFFLANTKIFENRLLFNSYLKNQSKMNLIENINKKEILDFYKDKYQRTEIINNKYFTGFSDKASIFKIDHHCRYISGKSLSIIFSKNGQTFLIDGFDYFNDFEKFVNNNLLSINNLDNLIRIGMLHHELTKYQEYFFKEIIHKGNLIAFDGYRDMIHLPVAYYSIFGSHNFEFFFNYRINNGIYRVLYSYSFFNGFSIEEEAINDPDNIIQIE